jgi:hypothetical protein
MYKSKLRKVRVTIFAVESHKNYIIILLLLLYLLTAIGLSPGGSTQLHTNNTIEQNKNTENNTNSEKRMWKSAGHAPSKNASFILAFALQLRKKHGKTSVTDEEPQSGKNLSQVVYSGCVGGLSNPAFNVHATYCTVICDLSGSTVLFPHDFMKGTTLRGEGGLTVHKMCLQM